MPQAPLRPSFFSMDVSWPLLLFAAKPRGDVPAVQQQRTQPPGLRAATGAGFAWGWHCWEDVPMAEGQGVFWGENGAALGTGWEAEAKKGLRGRG